MSCNTLVASSLVSGLVRKAGKRRHADQRALELTNVVGDIGGNELEHIVGYGGFLKFCFLAENRQPGLKIGRLDVGDQPPFETCSADDPRGSRLHGVAGPTRAPAAGGLHAGS